MADGGTRCGSSSDGGGEEGVGEEVEVAKKWRRRRVEIGGKLRNMMAGAVDGAAAGWRRRSKAEGVYGLVWAMGSVYKGHV